MEPTAMDVFALLFVILMVLSIYFLPSLIAGFRKHNNTAPLVILNTFFGWTFLGWVLCLAWSFSNNTRDNG